MPSDNTSHGEIAVPALRGSFGDWTYYGALLSLAEIAKRVSFADEVHKSKSLSDMIQRLLKGGPGGGRAKDIAAYLKTEKERFFNSLVVAVYGGQPEWIPIRIEKPALDMPKPPDDDGVLGTLQLSGSELLFAVDGQHRLAGMKKLSADQPDGKRPAALDDQVSVLFIAHRTDNIERTRRLFTTLNKTAVPVSKMERILLDENDAMAITARRLVEEHAYFREPRIAMNHTNNLGVDEKIALTTIGNLYDVLLEIFLTTTGKRRKELEYRRPTTAELDKYYAGVVKYFTSLSGIDAALDEYFAADSEEELQKVCKKHRNRKGGSVLMRPIGLFLVTEIAMSLMSRGHRWKKVVAHLPLRLNEPPYKGTIWSSQSTIDPKRYALCRDMLMYMYGDPAVSKESLKKKISDVTKKKAENVVLPKRIAISNWKAA
jgi:DNA sulfur modification protein DndB